MRLAYAALMRPSLVLAGGLLLAPLALPSVVSAQLCISIELNGERYSIGCDEELTDSGPAAPAPAPRARRDASPPPPYRHDPDLPAPWDVPRDDRFADPGDGSWDAPWQEEPAPPAPYAPPPPMPSMPMSPEPPAWGEWDSPPPAIVPQPAPRDANRDPCADPLVVEVLAHANASRAEAGLDPLACDATLARAAFSHSEDMCVRRYFSHTSPEGTTPTDRAREAGSRRRMIGENIAVGYSSPAEAHQGWMESDGHRRNILDGSYGHLGIGYAECGGHPFWTQVFSR
jgi:hypothetical protein